jgi:hypothetical protein
LIVRHLRIIIALLLGASLILLAGCNSNKDNGTGNGDTGSLEGVVLDAQTSMKISGASVNCGGQSTTSGADGSYTLLNIPVGSQTLTAGKTGYAGYSRQVTIPSPDPVDIYMTPGSVSGTNKVRLDCPVTIATPQVDTTIRLDVYITNDVSISAFSLGFHWSSDDVGIVGLEPGPALAVGANIYGAPYPASHLFLAGWIEYDPAKVITPKNDVLLISLLMSVPAGTSPQSIDIESAFVPPAGDFIFSPVGGGTITPTYLDCGTTDVVISAAGGAPRP